jgi:hypothetical protein
VPPRALAATGGFGFERSSEIAVQVNSHRYDTSAAWNPKLR